MDSSTMPLTPPFSGSFKAYEPSGLGQELDDIPDLGPSLLSSVASGSSSGYPTRRRSVDEPGKWKPHMTFAERSARREYLMEKGGKGADGKARKGLRIMIVTENFLPKVDGVTRTLAKLLEHLEREGHECMVLGPDSGMNSYASHPLVGTFGLPLVVYPGLKLNFLRPRFLARIADWEPDCVHFVDPIWLGGQTMYAMRYGWAGRIWAREEIGVDGHSEEMLEGAITASYHTNIATYASLFGLSALEPLIWKLQRRFYTKAYVNLCPSPSTAGMLEKQAFPNVRLWPRGVDVSHFSPSKRCPKLRASWGVTTKVAAPPAGPKVSGGLPITPPLTPQMDPVDAAGNKLQDRLVALYVGRVSWEKNLHLLIRSLTILPSLLPAGSLPPKMIFVGDGPARTELDFVCREQGIDAVFMGHKSGEELAQCYASADVFLFPSFTETFGQVVVEAMASGLPVIGLDADGTRDLVTHGRTGLLLSPTNPSRRVLPTISTNNWPRLLSDRNSDTFESCSKGYAELVVRAIGKDSEKERQDMGLLACTEGVAGRTWFDAMEMCVDGFREALRIAKAKREARQARGAHCTAALLYSAKKTNFYILIAAIVLLFAIYLFERR